MGLQSIVRVCVAVVLIVASACKGDGVEITKENKPKLEARMAQLTAIAKAHDTAALEQAPIDKLRFYGGQSNALIAQQSWFTGGEERSFVSNTGAISTVQDALKGQTSGVKSYYEDAFKQFLNAKYLVLAKAYISAGSISGDSFSGGSASGTLYIYDIASGKRVETLLFEAQPSSEVTAREGNENKSLESDLWYNLTQAGNKALAPHLDQGQRGPL